MVLTILYVAGAAWVGWCYATEGQQSPTVCPSKLLFHIPCATCGTTRACLLFLHGKLLEAVWMNPNVLAVAAFMIGFPVLGIYDGCRCSRFVPRLVFWLGRLFCRRWFITTVIVAELLILVKNIVFGI